MKKGMNLYHDVTIPAELSRWADLTTQTKEEFDHYYDLEKAHKVYNEIDWSKKDKDKNDDRRTNQAAKQYVKTLFADRADGHDVEHTLRVYTNAFMKPHKPER